MHKSNARNFLIRNGDTVQRSDLMDFIKFFSFLGLILALETFLIVIIFGRALERSRAREGRPGVNYE